MSVVSLHPRRWIPDCNLTDAALSGRIHVSDLDQADRAWLVASLTYAGRTTDLIASKLHCSRRLVQQIRCEPMAVVVTRLLEAEAAADKAMCRAKANTSAAAVTQLVHEVDHLKAARDDLIDQLSRMRRRYDAGCTPTVIVKDPRRRYCKRVRDNMIPLFEL